MRELFPRISDLFIVAKECIKVGFSKDTTRVLLSGKPVKFSGSLYSTEHNRKFQTEDSTAKIEPDPKEPSKFRLSIDGMSIVDWFKQKYKEFQKAIGINTRQPSVLTKNKWIRR